VIDNLGAQSHVAVSFEAPEYTANSDGLVLEVPQKESTPFYPRSPYGMVACNGILFNHESPHRCATGATPATTWRCSGACCSKSNRRIL
jgi:GDPmannose 4,6-dehydratase